MSQPRLVDILVQNSPDSYSSKSRRLSNVWKKYKKLLTTIIMTRGKSTAMQEYLDVWIDWLNWDDMFLYYKMFVASDQNFCCCCCCCCMPYLMIKTARWSCEVGGYNKQPVSYNQHKYWLVEWNASFLERAYTQNLRTEFRPYIIIINSAQLDSSFSCIVQIWHCDWIYFVDV